MDSLTQAALGAAVAYAGWDRALGRRAIAWGAALGTVPDLDVAATPFLDAVGALYWHRGWSHGVLITLLGGALTGLLVRRMHASAGLSFARAATVGVLIWATHVLIDFFTVYGTQILAPFSRYGFGSDNLFIIDPLYTVPLLVGLLAALFLRAPERRRRWNTIGLTVSSIYVLWSFAAQSWAGARFEAELQRQGIVTQRGFTAPTAFNTVLWRHLAAVEGGFVIGYASLLDRDDAVRFDFVPQGATLAKPLEASRALKAVNWFSHGYWVANAREGRVVLADLRFGEIRPGRGAAPETWGYVFSWTLDPAANEPALDPGPADGPDRGESLGAIWARLKGDREAL